MHRILFVDDDPSILKSLQRMVRSYSIEADMETAGSGREALDRIAKGGIDVIVSDVRMPEMDGIELLTRLKANPATQHIPVIMLTGDGDSTVKNVALDLGSMEFINKPPDATDLCARLRNVLRLKAYQDQLLRQNEVLTAEIIEAQKMEIAGILASQVAHDLNNILHAIVGNTELVLYKTSDRNVHAELQKVIKAAEHAAGLVRQIRDLGRRSTGEPESTRVCTVIDECVDFLRVLVPVEVTVIWTNPDLRTRTAIAATSLYQVVMNLVMNAVHAMDDSGTLSVQVTETELAQQEAAAESVAAGRFVVVSLTDTGHGIDPSILPHIFEQSFTTKIKGEGTGIGLAVVNRIVRDGGGFVKVESTPGVGTTFAVHLPVLDALEHPMKPAAVPARANG